MTVSYQGKQLAREFICPPDEALVGTPDERTADDEKAAKTRDPHPLYRNDDSNVPFDESKPKWFWGHLVVILPKLGWMLDPTIDQIRTEVLGFIPDIMALPLDRDGGVDWIDEFGRNNGLKPPIAKSLSSIQFEHDGFLFQGVWFDDAANRSWMGRSPCREKRSPLVSELLKRFQVNGKKVDKMRPTPIGDRFVRFIQSRKSAGPRLLVVKASLANNPQVQKLRKDGIKLILFPDEHLDKARRMFPGRKDVEVMGEYSRIHPEILAEYSEAA
jgi:hypothetical protein